jgi:3'-5' exoribonuclease
MTHCTINKESATDCNLPANNTSKNCDSATTSSLLEGQYRVIELHGNSAQIFNERATLRISNKSTSVSSIKVGQIVLVKPKHLIYSNHEHIKAIHLIEYQKPDANVNVFELIPYAWVKDRDLTKRAAKLWCQLSESHRLLFNAIFWDAGRFERFCRQPSSMIGHHSEPSGNLRHTIEVAEEMRNLCLTRDYANMDLGVLAALLHDCGKADEYMPNVKGGWDLTDRGKLLGHKVSAVEWIISAVTHWHIQLPLDHYEGLLHIMTAIPHAPDWMGIRAPVTPESLLLSMADRLSGHDDLMMQTLCPNGGFGRYHKHLKSSPFSVRG